MAVLLPCICFIIIFFILGSYNPSANKRSLLLKTVLAFSLLVAVVTELLSLINGITFGGLLLVWLGICISGIKHLFSKRDSLKQFVLSLRESVSFKINKLSNTEKVLLAALGVLFILLLAQGIIYPPNNRDSLTYHMGRIPSWIAQGSVEHFPTHIVRQLYQPPLAEYIIMHLNILNHSDYFSSVVQFFALLWVMVAATLIVKELGFGRRFQLMAFVLAGTLPEALLQASSTQNDIVVASFVLIAFYYMLQAVKEPGFKNYFWFGLAVGLSLFTKGTAYMYLAPVLLVFGVDVLIKLFKTKKLTYLYSGLITVALLPLLINSAHYYRNYSFCKNILGVDHEESRLYKNEAMSVKYFAGNAVKNADLHMGVLGVPHITLIANKAVKKFFNKIGVDLNDQAVTIPGTSGIPGDMLWAYLYGGMVATHDDYGPNFFHFGLVVLSLAVGVFVITRKKATTNPKLLLLTVLLQAVVFILYLKWQSLGTRLHTAIFLLSVPLVCYMAAVNGFVRKLTAILIPVILLYAYVVVLFNFGRPLITKDALVLGFRVTRPISVNDDRYKKYFSLITNPTIYAEYTKVSGDIKRLGYKNIGFISGNNDWQYPLFKDCYSRPLVPVHLFVTNYSKSIRQKHTNVDCIVSTNTNKAYIDYNGKRYINQSSSNKVVYFYRLISHTLHDAHTPVIRYAQLFRRSHF